MVNAYSGGALGQVGVALAFAVVAMIYALGHLSGGHINPVVTLVFWSVRRFPTAEVIPYVLAQCAGAVAASVALRAVLGLLTTWALRCPASLSPQPSASRGFAARAVGLTVGSCALMGGPLTGASMNPGRSFDQALVGGPPRAAVSTRRSGGQDTSGGGGSGQHAPQVEQGTHVLDRPNSGPEKVIWF